MKKKMAVVGIFLAVFTGYCFSFSLQNDVQLEMKEQRIRDFSMEGLTLVFHVNIRNSSSKTYFLSGYSYRVVVNQKDYIRLQTDLDKALQIDPREETLVAFPVKITYKNLFRILPEMKEEQHAVCNLVGWARFSDGRRDKGRHPLAFTGDFPVFWEPELDLVRLRVKTLTIGGAELAFEVKFVNRNRFELFVKRISYNLELEGQVVDKGRIRGDKNIEKEGERVFSIPLLLNFFEEGKNVSHSLKQGSLACRFWGEVGVQTVWGELAIPFDRSGALPVVRNP